MLYRRLKELSRLLQDDLASHLRVYALNLSTILCFTVLRVLQPTSPTPVSATNTESQVALKNTMVARTRAAVRTAISTLLSSVSPNWLRGCFQKFRLQTYARAEVQEVCNLSGACPHDDLDRPPLRFIPSWCCLLGISMRRHGSESRPRKLGRAAMKLGLAGYRSPSCALSSPSRFSSALHARILPAALPRPGNRRLRVVPSKPLWLNL